MSERTKMCMCGLSGCRERAIIRHTKLVGDAGVRCYVRCMLLLITLTKNGIVVIKTCAPTVQAKPYTWNSGTGLDALSREYLSMLMKRQREMTKDEAEEE